MLPVEHIQGVHCPGGSNHGASRLAVLRTPASSASRAPWTQGQQQGHQLARSKPMPVGPGRRGAGPRGVACAASGSAGLAVAADTSAHSGSGCLSRQVIDFGYDKNIEDKYEWGRELGKGGNGVVRVVRDRATGEEYACKALPKALGADASDAKRAGHVDSIKREVEVMRRLEGSLAVVRLVDVFEDDSTVFIVQELCTGGELHHRIGDRHYSERTVASFMRAVLRTLAQCHSHRILHRDIKPGNFMLLDSSDASPLKAIDFGLAVPFDPEGLPRDDLGLEGTPWFMAPEVLSSQVVPASDVWSAGVMAHQLLTGRLPFDDHRSPHAPSVSAIWRSVLCDTVKYNAPWWGGVSDEAKEFVAALLERDPAKRPTAKEALSHPWLRGDSSERSAGKQIDASVVQRIQRFAQNSRFKRGVLRMIAEELLAHPGAAAALAASAAAQGGSAGEPAGGGGGSARGGAGGSGRRGAVDADSAALRELLRKLELDAAGAGAVDKARAAEAIAGMGFRLQPSELAQLVTMLDTSNSGKVRRAAVAASQIDFKHLQQSDADAWAEVARRVFSRLDADQDGVIGPDEIIASLRAALPEDELRATLAHVKAEAGGGAEHGLDFDSFLDLLKVGSVDSLDMFESRLEFASPGSIGRLQALLDASHHGSDGSTHHRSGRGGGLFRKPPSPAAAPLPLAGAAAAFRFDTGPETAKPAAPAAGAGGFRFDTGPETASAPNAPAAGAARPLDPWQGLTVGAPPSLLPPRGGVGAPRGVGAGEVRIHGGSLYKNLAAR